MLPKLPQRTSLQSDGFQQFSWKDELPHGLNTAVRAAPFPVQEALWFSLWKKCYSCATSPSLHHCDCHHFNQTSYVFLKISQGKNNYADYNHGFYKMHYSNPYKEDTM